MKPRRASVAQALAALPSPRGEAEDDMPLPSEDRKTALEWTKATLVSRDDPRSHYDIDEAELLGKGGFSSVYKGRDRSTGRAVAIKKMEINRKNHPTFLLIETEIHAKSAMNHPNIVQFLDSFHLPDVQEFWIVLEYIDGCTAQDIVMLDAGFSSETAIAYVIRGVTRAILACHQARRIHRDVKLQNVLLAKNGVVKLTDFGLAAQLTEKRARRTSMVSG